MSDPLASRRPLKSRSSSWASAASRALLKAGVKPNQVSVMSVVFAAGGAAGLLLVPWPWLAWALCAAGIQLRLLCNLMDGMLAVEGGLRSPNGDLYNEFPDRLADVAVLAAMGLAAGTRAAEILGWTAACGALCTAWIRSHGSSLTGRHDFRGPMAKQHRMALATALCVIAAVLNGSPHTATVLLSGLALMNAGLVLTVVRRMTVLSQALKERAKS
jgi:phosphatidylglycerophosphate synthase